MKSKRSKPLVFTDLGPDEPLALAYVLWGQRAQLASADALAKDPGAQLVHAVAPAAAAMEPAAHALQAAAPAAVAM